MSNYDPRDYRIGNRDVCCAWAVTLVSLVTFVLVASLW
jgi:hypothetical protein